MSPVAVGMANIVDLKPERVLQVVARLFLGESGDDNCAPRDVHDHQAAGVMVSRVMVYVISWWECAGIYPGRTSAGERRSLILGRATA